ncbi:type I restriction enzyme HsdR N-terminal domain-containing protein [bacterium]|nr:type I restriction enzyme HsdR N-terminal domain-containing protein [bacterium]
MNTYPLNDFDFDSVNADDFTEESVRELILSPILQALGYGHRGKTRVRRNPRITHPIVQIGSKSRKVTSIPDYLMEVDGKPAWVLDAKGPKELASKAKHREQAYFYALHPEINVNLYAISNGIDFVVWNREGVKPLNSWRIKDLDKHWNDVIELLSPSAFGARAVKHSQATKRSEKDSQFYSTRSLLPEIVVKKQQARRHFGVHGYFTKQAWNVVQEYIKYYSQPGDTVLDPFGGSGVTAIEAIVTGRKAIHIDLNPMSQFLVQSLLTIVVPHELTSSVERLLERFESQRPKSKRHAQALLKTLKYPKGTLLPPTSDVEHIEELFTTQQLCELAILRKEILKTRDKDIRKVLLLAFSGTISKVNRTYHPSKARAEGGGDNGPFRYFRYRLAPAEVHLNVAGVFRTKIKKIIAAQKELNAAIDEKSLRESVVLKGDAALLDSVNSESIDYVYTDPPYGSKINYLDLSVMWNEWLGLPVSESDYKRETIEDGSRNHTVESYKDSLGAAIREMYRVMKYDRWMSFVFAHKDPKYWHFILETAEACGFEYVGTVAQGNGAASFKKRQNPFSVLQGQLIINFRKVRNPRRIARIVQGTSVYDLIIETIESVIASKNGARLEDINDELIMKGLEMGFLDILSKEYKDLTPLLMDNFEYHEDEDKFHMRKEKKFRAQLPVELRIRYFLISYLRRCGAERKSPTTDEVILYIMPLLKNGITPENQTILNELAAVGEHVGENQWRLRQDGNLELDLR